MQQLMKHCGRIVAATLIALIALSSIPPTHGVARAETGVIYKVSASSGLRVREGAGTSYRVLRTIKNGTKVKHVGSSSGWWLIETQAGKRGYVDPKYLVKSGSGSGGNVSPSGTLMYINAVGRVNVRRSASSSSGIKGRLRGGTVVRLLSTSGDWAYIQVYSNGNRGYVSLRYLLKY